LYAAGLFAGTTWLLGASLQRQLCDADERGDKGWEQLAVYERITDAAPFLLMLIRHNNQGVYMSSFTPDYRLIQRTYLWCLILGLFLLAACGVAEPASSGPASTPPLATATEEAPTATSATSQIPGATAMDVQTTPAAAQLPAAWQSYHGQAAGYRVEYPAGWMVSEQANADGSFATTFAPSGGGAGITVLVLPRASFPADDLPNTRCEQVTIGGLAGTRCFDTIARSTSIALAGQDRIFTIAADGKRLDPQILERFLGAFAPTP
jgi:hypothetical protein